jgi:hypothetical protein
MVDLTLLKREIKGRAYFLGAAGRAEKKLGRDASSLDHRPLGFRPPIMVVTPQARGVTTGIVGLKG